MTISRKKVNIGHILSNIETKMYTILSEKEFEVSIMKTCKKMESLQVGKVEDESLEQFQKRISSSVDNVVRFSTIMIIVDNNTSLRNSQIDEIVRLAEETERYIDLMPCTFFMMMEGSDKTNAHIYEAYFVYMKALNDVLKVHQKASSQNSANNFKAMNKMAPEGTVSEIAEKYGVSKSEVRRLKNAGELHTLTGE